MVGARGLRRLHGLWGSTCHLLPASSVPRIRTQLTRGQLHTTGQVGRAILCLLLWEPLSSANNGILTEDNEDPMGTWILTPVPNTPSRMKVHTVCGGRDQVSACHGLRKAAFSESESAALF